MHACREEADGSLEPLGFGTDLVSYRYVCMGM